MPTNKHINPDALIILIISACVFYFTFVFQEWQGLGQHIVSDVPFHAKFVINFAAEHNFPAYTIWYRLVYIFSGFSSEYIYIAYATITLLSLFVLIKFWITRSILNVGISGNKNASLMAAALIFVMPIISFYSCGAEGVNRAFCFSSLHIYLGNISPNQWHNSTLILAMPFNLLLFYFALKNICSEKTIPFLLMAAFSTASIICKPNYALAFLPVFFALVVFVKIKERQYLRGAIQGAIVIIPSIMILAAQWYLTFVQNDLHQIGARTVIAPFFVWSNYTPHITTSLLLSVLFPIYILIFFYQKIDMYLTASWLVFLVALVIASVFSEMPNWGAGNYFWGAIAANYILFVFSSKLLLSQPICWRVKLGYATFSLHFASGFLLLASFFIRQTSLMF